MKPLLSICIPTYNRATYLDECLKSITLQFKNYKILQKVEIVISDNASPDDTQELVKRYQKFFQNIRYYRNDTNIGGVPNTMKVPIYAQGEYVWFFSDDDTHTSDSLQTIISIIEKNHPDAIYANLNLGSKDLKNIVDKNLLRISKDRYCQNKKELFKFLEGEFFLPIDWLLTTYSNVLLTKKLFDENLPKAISYDLEQYVCPQAAFVYFVPDDYKVYICAKPLVNFRSDNRSFGSQDKVKFLLFWYAALNRHYAEIMKANAKNIGLKFLYLMFLKSSTRNLRLAFLKKFNYDISDLLVKLFYK